jgi:hypothetical protein
MIGATTTSAYGSAMSYEAPVIEHRERVDRPLVPGRAYSQNQESPPAAISHWGLGTESESVNLVLGDCVR